MIHKAYLALGTNIGQRADNLQKAINAFAPQLGLLASSRLYETEPWGYADQPAFLNMAVCVETNFDPFELLRYLKLLETQLGRMPNFRNGPRLIDLDILFYDDMIVETPEVVIPHPRLQDRAFVLVPLVDIAPDFIHPVLGVSILELESKIDNRGVKLFLN